MDGKNWLDRYFE